MTFTENPVRNGVDTATLFATLDAVKGDPGIAKFRFRATNSWVSGTHNRSSFHGPHLGRPRRSLQVFSMFPPSLRPPERAPWSTSPIRSPAARRPGAEEKQ